jgi:hypothetical protein
MAAVALSTQEDTFKANTVLVPLSDPRLSSVSPDVITPGVQQLRQL